MPESSEPWCLPVAVLTATTSPTWPRTAPVSLALPLQEDNDGPASDCLPISHMCVQHENTRVNLYAIQPTCILCHCVYMYILNKGGYYMNIK